MGVIDPALSQDAPPGEGSNSGAEVESLKRKIQQLEDLIMTRPAPEASSSATQSHSPAVVATTGMGEMLHDGTEEQPGVARSLAYKRRLFGQSHLMHATTMFPETIAMTETCLNNPDIVSWLKRCKSLSRVIKAGRTSPWPAPLTPDLPEKPVTDALVHLYLRTFETVYRVLHVPTFQQAYDRVWTSGGAEADETFLVQLKLVLAIGSVMYDDTFSLRKLAIRWICEAQTWHAKPVTKSRLNIPSLQTSLLLIIAREIVGVGGDSTWISAGALFRIAIYMGLHRDPEHMPRMSLYVAEMRRRLWNTILELMLQSSMSLGAPPLLSLDDFDTQPPGNFDDIQISPTDGIDRQPLPRPDHEFTQMSTAIALRRTLPARLAVAKYLNQLGSQTSYPETLRLDKELKAAYRDLCRTLKSPDTLLFTAPSAFTLRLVDYTLHRYMISLHVPFFGLGLSDAAFAYSRKTAVDLALNIWPAAHPSTAIAAERSQQQDRTDDGAVRQAQDDLARLIACGVGIFRSTAHIAALVAMAELRATLQEEPGLLGHASNVSSRDVLSVAEEDGPWTLRCMRAGEVNVKAALLQGMLMAHVSSLMRGEGRDELPRVLLEAAEGVKERCLPILEAAAAEGGTTTTTEVSDEFEADASGVTWNDTQNWMLVSFFYFYSSGRC